MKRAAIVSGLLLLPGLAACGEGAPSVPTGPAVSPPAQSLAVAALATFTVTTTDDAGPGSLRQAILDANSSPGLDGITFAIPGPGPHEIRPASPLPTITDPVVVDGYTQAGSAPNSAAQGFNATLMMRIDGADAGDDVDGLRVAAGSTTVRGLIITGFRGPTANGIALTSLDGNVIEGNVIGTDMSGAAGLGNGRAGVSVTSSGNRVGGTAAAARNVLSGNGTGIWITSGSGNQVEGNLIGTALEGTAALGNTFAGVRLQFASSNAIGGAAPGEGNLISGNGSREIEIVGADSRENIVRGNLVGTDVTGTADLSSADFGIIIQGGASDNRVGGTEPADRNVFAGAGVGVRLQSPGTTGNRVQGNFIGTDITGTEALGNVIGAYVGISAADNHIGGAEEGAGNVISGNAANGVNIEREGTTGNSVLGNLIGPDVTGTAALGNGGSGVLIFGPASDNVVGSSSPGGGNVIAFNEGGGVVLLPGSGTGNRILGNRIFDNVGPGIDLEGDGPTPNDPADLDTGPNELQNHPELSSATETAEGTTVSGSLHSSPDQTFTLQFFSNDAVDPTGFGEGQVFLGEASITTDAGGTGGFSITLHVPVADGAYVTSTATDGSGNTSEFSAGVVVGGDSGCAAVTEIPTLQCEALVALFNSTNGPGWSDNTGWSATSTPCSWFGVACSSGSVVGLFLSDNGLSGTIPPAVAGLADLRTMRLHRNGLSGSIPSELGNLSSLRDLNLQVNELAGTIPTALWRLPELRRLNLSFNELEGSIPPDVGGLANLEFLDLSVNRLSGPLPTELGSLARLETLLLARNQLTGGIPPDLGNLASLRDLSLDSNPLGGTIPPTLGDIPDLRSLVLGRTGLTGEIPPSLGNTSLTSLLLHNNRLDGPIPPELGNLTGLVILWLHGNQLTGPIPPELGSLASLEILFLQGNRLSGRIPAELGRPSRLRELWASDNQLSGPIPAELGNLTELDLLRLHRNDLSGLLPLPVAAVGVAATECDLRSNADLYVPDAPDYRALTDPPGQSICGLELQPADAVAEAIDRQVADLADDGTLNDGQATSLSRKLEQVLDKIEAGQRGAAVNLLGAFIHQVRDLVETGVLPSDDGGLLIEQARSLIQQLGG